MYNEIEGRPVAGASSKPRKRGTQHIHADGVMNMEYDAPEAEQEQEGFWKRNDRHGVIRTAAVLGVSALALGIATTALAMSAGKSGGSQANMHKAEEPMFGHKYVQRVKPQQFRAYQNGQKYTHQAQPQHRHYFNPHQYDFQHGQVHLPHGGQYDHLHRYHGPQVQHHQPRHVQVHYGQHHDQAHDHQLYHNNGAQWELRLQKIRAQYDGK